MSQPGEGGKTPLPPRHHFFAKCTSLTDSPFCPSKNGSVFRQHNYSNFKDVDFNCFIKVSHFIKILRTISTPAIDCLSKILINRKMASLRQLMPKPYEVIWAQLLSSDANGTMCKPRSLWAPGFGVSGSSFIPLHRQLMQKANSAHSKSLGSICLNNFALAF